MKRSRSAAIAALCCLGVAAFVVGCRTEPAGPVEPRTPSTGNDPCAGRLHEISGALAFYYATHKKLPISLTALAGGPMPLPPAVCPVSGRPYVYSPEGVTIAGRTAKLVLYDAEPTHAGMRWGIQVNFGGTAPMTAKVVLVPEKDISAAQMRR